MILYKNEPKKLTYGLTHTEFKCRCENPSCRATIVDEEFLNIYSKFRQAVGVPLIVNSAFRCALQNEAVGGVAKSQHQVGKAIDIVLSSLTAKYTLDEIDKLAKNSGFKFIQFYPSKNFLHLDIVER